MTIKKKQIVSIVTFNDQTDIVLEELFLGFGINPSKAVNKTGQTLGFGQIVYVEEIEGQPDEIIGIAREKHV